MKRSAILGTAAAAVIVAGGAIGGYALTQDEPTPEPTVQSATAAPTPEATETPIAEPTSEPTPEATGEPSATPEPAPEASYSPEVAELIYVTNVGRLSHLGLTDEEILAAAESVCATDAGTEGTQHIPGATELENRQFAADVRGKAIC